MALNSALLPPFLIESAILDDKMAATNPLKVFAKFVSAKGMEEEEDKLAEEEEGKVSSEWGGGGKSKDSLK